MWVIRRQSLISKLQWIFRLNDSNVSVALCTLKITVMWSWTYFGQVLRQVTVTVKSRYGTGRYFKFCSVDTSNPNAKYRKLTSTNLSLWGRVTVRSFLRYGTLRTRYCHLNGRFTVIVCSECMSIKNWS